jgi:hypothetical protein
MMKTMPADAQHQHRADSLAATICALRDIVTHDAETKEEFIARVRAILSEDPDERLDGIVKREREACAAIADLRALRCEENTCATRKRPK